MTEYGEKYRNINVYNKHVKKHKKEYSYLKALRALCEGRTTNIAHEDAFNLLISDLKRRKIRTGIESQLMIMVQLLGFYLRRKILTENFDSCDEHRFYIKLNTAIILVFFNVIINHCDIVSSRSSPSHFTKDSPFITSQVRTRSTTK